PARVGDTVSTLRPASRGPSRRISDSLSPGSPPWRANSSLARASPPGNRPATPYGNGSRALERDPFYAACSDSPRLGLPRSFAHQHQDRRLRHDEVALVFERDLHRGLAEEQRVIAHARLDRQVLHFGAADLPRLLIERGGIAHRSSRARRDDPAALHLAALERRRRKIEPHGGALLALGRSDEHPVADDDQPLGRGGL